MKTEKGGAWRWLAVIAASFALFLQLTSPCAAVSSSTNDGSNRAISNYHVDIVVNENNTYDITEQVTFMPRRDADNNITHTLPHFIKIHHSDGPDKYIRATVSNLQLSVPASTEYSVDRTQIVVKGDSLDSTNEYGYTLKYTYNFGLDTVSDGDELYLALPSGGQSRAITNFSFTVHLPQDFNSANVDFYSIVRKTEQKIDKITNHIVDADVESLVENQQISYVIAGNDIIASYENSLESNEQLALRVILPNGYFASAFPAFEARDLLIFVIPAVGLAIIIFLRFRIKYNDRLIKTTATQSIRKLDSIDLAIAKYGGVGRKDLAVLIIELAIQGYIRLEEVSDEPISPKPTKTRSGMLARFVKEYRGTSLILHKIKDYNGEDENLRILFERIFKDNATSLDTRDEMMRVRLNRAINLVAERVCSREYREKCFEPTAWARRLSFATMILSWLSVFMLYGFSINNFAIACAFMVISLFPIFLLSDIFPAPYEQKQAAVAKPNFIIRLVGIIVGTIRPVVISYILYEILRTSFLYDYDGFYFDFFYLAALIWVIFAQAMMYYLGNYMVRRTTYGTKLCHEADCLIDLFDGSSDAREKVSISDADYAYSLLPYALTLDKVGAWESLFIGEGGVTSQPDWYTTSLPDDWRSDISGIIAELRIRVNEPEGWPRSPED